MSTNPDNASTEKIDLHAIYGQAPPPSETPALIEESMRSFNEMLEIGKTENSNWRLAQERCPHECRDEFKLTFLRCALFQVERAVTRYTRYWDSRLEIFGPERAFLPILDLGPNGAMKDNLKELSLGYGRCSLKRACQDPDGRAIILLDGSKLDEARDNPEITQIGLVRASWYIVHYCLLSESAQRNGFVIVYTPVKSIKSLGKSPAQSMSASVKGAVPVRLAGVHITNPPTLVVLFLKIARNFVGKKIQQRMHLHNKGSDEKNLESFLKYGLDKTRLPKEVGGDIVFESLMETGRQLPNTHSGEKFS